MWALSGSLVSSILQTIKVYEINEKSSALHNGLTIRISVNMCRIYKRHSFYGGECVLIRKPFSQIIETLNINSDILYINEH